MLSYLLTYHMCKNENGGVMEKIDFKNKYKEFYNQAKNKISMLNVPEFSYLTINGNGDPNNCKEYKEAIEALYSLAYALKFKIKKELQIADYGVMPLEGQWWCENMAEFSISNKDNWIWNAQIMQPEFITPEIFRKTLAEIQKKKNLPALEKIELKPFTDCLAVQILHIGPYSAEEETISKLHEYT